MRKAVYFEKNFFGEASWRCLRLGPKAYMYIRIHVFYLLLKPFQIVKGSLYMRSVLGNLRIEIIRH